MCKQVFCPAGVEPYILTTGTSFTFPPSYIKEKEGVNERENKFRRLENESIKPNNYEIIA